MKVCSITMSVIMLFMAACSRKSISTPILPEFTRISVFRGSSISNDLDDPEILALLRAFIFQSKFAWRLQSEFSTPTSGDVGIVLYEDTRWKELVQFGPNLLIVGSHISSMENKDVDALLKIISLTREDVFASVTEQGTPNQSVQTNPSASR